MGLKIGRPGCLHKDGGQSGVLSFSTPAKYFVVKIFFNRMRPVLRAIILSAGLLGSTAPAACAQDAWNPHPLPARQLSIGFQLGMTDAWGDVGTAAPADHYRNSYYWRHLHGAGSVALRYTPKPWLAARVGFLYGQLFASDQYNQRLANADPVPTNRDYMLYTRNQNFRSDLWEGSVLLELLPFRAFGDRPLGHAVIQPVLLAGGALAHFDPETSYDDPATGDTRWVATHDLHLEGEGLPVPGAPGGWSRTAGALALGGGLRFELTPQLALGLEALWRFTSTDYLDGVSSRYVDPVVYDTYLTPEDAVIARTVGNRSSSIDAAAADGPGGIRGNPAKKDSYSTISVSLQFHLATRQPRD